MHPLERVHRGRHRRGVVAHPPSGLIPPGVRERAREVRTESVELEGKVHVLHHVVDQLLQLGPLLIGQGRQEARHRGHPPRHLLEQLVKRAWPLGEQITVAAHELLERGLDVLAALPSLE